MPYSIRIVNRDALQKDGTIMCVYCFRTDCNNCPLPFDDKITLQSFLEKAGVSTQSYFYYEDMKEINNASRDKKKVVTPQKKASQNLEFELEVTFNGNKCWAAYENLQRFQPLDKSISSGVERQTPPQNDKVTIGDCFRQFMKPEKLSS